MKNILNKTVLNNIVVILAAFELILIWKLQFFGPYPYKNIDPYLIFRLWFINNTLLGIILLLLIIIERKNKTHGVFIHVTILKRVSCGILLLASILALYYYNNLFINTDLHNIFLNVSTLTIFTQGIIIAIIVLIIMAYIYIFLKKIIKNK